jgi:hypothetical protein
MNLYCHKSRAYQCSLSILFIVFSMRLISTPLTYTDFDKLTSDGSNSAASKTSSGPEHKPVFKALFTEFTEAESITSIEFNKNINRSLRDLHRVLTRNLNMILVPFIGIILFFIINRYFHIYFVQPRSIIAYKIGGHAPPWTSNRK